MTTGAYATWHQRSGLGCWATAAALRTLAGVVRATGRLALDAPPPDWSDETPVDAVAVTDAGGAPLTFRRAGGVLEVAGGADARDALAETLENLAECTDRLGDPVAPHVDLEHFPGHGWLDPAAEPLAVVLVAGPP